MNRISRLLVVLIVILIGIITYQNTSIFPYLSRNGTVSSAANSSQKPSESKPLAIAEQTATEQVIDQSLPAVVTISEGSDNSSSNFGINPFNPFSQQPQTAPDSGNIGSGFIISPDGYLVTNKHVVSDLGVAYTVITYDNKKYKVQKIFRDPLNDLAILKINAQGLTPINLGDSSNLKLGQTVLAMGTPLGEFKNTVTRGIISGLGRGIDAGSPFGGAVEQLNNVIQTDAPISAGNSGGPLVDLSGTVIGINTAVAAQGQNIGFAIPINTVKNSLNNFRSNGSSFEQAFLGVRYQMIDQTTAANNHVAQGAYVIEVISGSPADKAGIKSKDIITVFDGKKIGGSDSSFLSQLITKKKPGDKVPVKVWRNNNEFLRTLTLSRAP